MKEKKSAKGKRVAERKKASSVFTARDESWAEQMARLKKAQEDNSREMMELARKIETGIPGDRASSSEEASDD